MQFICPLIVVNDLAASRDFYQRVLGQQVENDFGENVLFQGGFSIHDRAHFAALINAAATSITHDSKNFELYFEEEDLDAFLDGLGEMKGIEYVHGLEEQPWGQRVIRLYDPDRHIIEVGEPMESVAKRFLRSGLTIEETAARTSIPIDFVRRCL